MDNCREKARLNLFHHRFQAAELAMAFWALIVMERNKSYILYVRRLWIMQQADNIGWSQEKSQDHSVQIDSSSLPW